MTEDKRDEIVYKIDELTYLSAVKGLSSTFTTVVLFIFMVFFYAPAVLNRDPLTLFNFTAIALVGIALRYKKGSRDKALEIYRQLTLLDIPAVNFQRLTIEKDRLRSIASKYEISRIDEIIELYGLTGLEIEMSGKPLNRYPVSLELIAIKRYVNIYYKRIDEMNLIINRYIKVLVTSLIALALNYSLITALDIMNPEFGFMPQLYLLLFAILALSIQYLIVILSESLERTKKIQNHNTAKFYLSKKLKDKRYSQ